MKIAYDAKRFFRNTSGLGNYSRDLIRILADYYPENEYHLLFKDKNGRGGDILEKPNVFFDKISKGFLARQTQMGFDAQQIDADIFHGLSGELPFAWKDKKIRKIVTIHDLIFVRYPKFYSFFDRLIHFYKFKKAVDMADLVIAISEQTKRDIIEFLRIDEDKIRVVYQGCHHLFKENIDTETLNNIKSKYNLPNRFILNVGTIEERKNILSVVKALQGTDIPLIIIGKKTKYHIEIEKELIRNPIKIQFLEGVSIQELAGIYRLADIFVYPSLFEGFGIPIIEALYSNTVVVTSNTSSLTEAGGSDSVYINPLDIKDIRAKLLFLWENESERERRAEKGKIFVQKFNDDIIAKNLMDVYEELMRKY